MTYHVPHFIGGAPFAGGDARQDIPDPATGQIIGRVSMGGSDEVDRAVRAAAEAQPAWAERTPSQRAEVMFKFRELVVKHRDELAELVSREHGKMLDDARGSVGRGLDVISFACGIPQMLKGEHSKGTGPGIDSWTVREPLGVCAGITPFNFPAMVPLWMIPVALACGNSFVLKPSERDPACPLRLVELLHEAGLPDGVLNMVNGGKPAVDALLHHPDVAAISFVGSTPVGEYIYSEGSRHGKRVQALCGAKNHMVVMPDADIPRAADAAMAAAFGSAGERCMAISVAVTVGEETGNRLVEELAPRVRALKVGPYTDPEAEMGPVITAAAKRKIEGYIAAGVDQGAELVVDGRGLKLQGYEDGYFLGGSLFDRVTRDMTIYTDEIFGPVLSVVRAKDADEAVKLVNDHEYGNGTAIFTNSGDTADAFAKAVEIGMVGVNVPIPVPVAYHSFGGWKRSLFGDHAIHGPEGVHFNTRLKTITARWPETAPGHYRIQQSV